jgi:spore germination protein GerM
MKRRRKKASRNARRSFFVAFLAVAVFVLAIVFFRGGGREEIGAGKAIPAEVARRPAAGPGESRVVTLFFASEDDTLLHPEEREIPAGPSPAEEAAAAVRELIRGPEGDLLPSLPQGTGLRRLFITKEGIAYVDFTREIASRPSGSSEELASVYSVVNTLAFNFRPIKKVFILVEGAERETLGGHVNLREAFLPQYALDAK